MNKDQTLILPVRIKRLKVQGYGNHSYLFYTGLAIGGYIAGGLLFSVALLVGTTDICIPSIIYNFLFKVKV